MIANLSFISALSGLAGVATISAGALIASLTYEGRMEQRYRIWNHFVSDPI